jgi:hypothetical protein
MPKSNRSSNPTAHAASASTNGHTDPRRDMNGRMPGDEGHNPYDTVAANEKHRARQATERATAATAEKRLKRFGSHRYDVAVLDGITEKWARNLAGKTARKNIERDSSRVPPDVMFTGADAINAGASDTQIAALPELSLDDIAALKMRAAAIRQDWQNQVREVAAHIGSERAAEAYLELETRVDLADYAPPATPFVVDGLIPKGKSLGFFAERKAGKTTTNVALTRSLLTGEPFLGRFKTFLPADAEVALLDTEMGDYLMYRELLLAGMGTDLRRRVNYHNVVGMGALLDVRNEAVRAYWRQRIKPGSFLIVDCLYAVLASADVDESSPQVARVLEGFKTLAVDLDAAGYAIVHHLGKDPDRGARGHSSIEGMVDVMATLRLTGMLDEPRTFEAFGRAGVSVPPVQVNRAKVGEPIDPQVDGDYRLSLSANTPSVDRVKDQNRRDDDTAWRVINDKPGASTSALEEMDKALRRDLSKARMRQAVIRLRDTGRIVNKGTEGATKWHALSEADPTAATPGDVEQRHRGEAADPAGKSADHPVG